MAGTLEPQVPSVEVAPYFLDSREGRLFAVHHRPGPDAPCHGHVLVVPPFNEEMNRCRAMLTLQARALAAHGIGTLVLDLFGSGDSAGGYRDGRWEIWLDNLQAALTWLDGQRGARRALLGVRMGALLAAESLRRRNDPATALLAWQPVIDGKQHFTQFLRLRLAAQLDRPDQAKETTGFLRQQLAAGHCVEVAGYEIHPELAAAIDAAHLARLAPPAGTPVFWLEQVLAADTPEPTSASLKLLETWSAAGLTPDVAVYQDPPFWQAHERAIAPRALELTTGWLRDQWMPA
ncbi:exosortase A system-associated hydrolase 2 [Methylomagnum ishizawai]|uniref:Exosortase A system-associated hydrolase 2 n=1 Tax=Methylomagnum ishizawai TaxID=1760988 RepID=A0A1Y6D6W9_9GAMM|nr:exosortase A system-associated hydrolase 2 [Methylomagnum ishizawai]